jgi:hypothetical protein
VEEATRLKEPLPASAPIVLSSDVDVSRLVLKTLRSIQNDGAIPRGSPYAYPACFPYQRLASTPARLHAAIANGA